MHLARMEEGQAAAVPDIAKQNQIPEQFLNQIMLTLRNAGFVRSRRGAQGGYVLAREPREMTLGEIARLMDGPLAPIPCASVTAYEPCPSCPEPESCSLRITMRQVRDAISDILDKRSVADLLEKS